MRLFRQTTNRPGHFDKREWVEAVTETHIGKRWWHFVLPRRHKLEYWISDVDYDALTLKSEMRVMDAVEGLRGKCHVMLFGMTMEGSWTTGSPLKCSATLKFSDRGDYLRAVLILGEGDKMKIETA